MVGRFTRLSMSREDFNKERLIARIVGATVLAIAGVVFAFGYAGQVGMEMSDALLLVSAVGGAVAGYVLATVIYLPFALAGGVFEPGESPASGRQVVVGYFVILALFAAAGVVAVFALARPALASPEAGAVPAGCALVGDIEVGTIPGETEVVIPAGANELRFSYRMAYDFTNEPGRYTITRADGTVARTGTLTPVGGGENISLSPGTYTVSIAAFQNSGSVDDQRLVADLYACQTALDTDTDPAAEPLPDGVLADFSGSGDTTETFDATRAQYVRVAYDTQGPVATLILRLPNGQSSRTLFVQGDGYVDIPISVAPSSELGTPAGIGRRVPGWTVDVDAPSSTTYSIEVSRIAQTGDFESFSGFAPPQELGCARQVSGRGTLDGSLGGEITFEEDEVQKDIVAVVRNYLGPSPSYFTFSEPVTEDFIYRETLAEVGTTIRRIEPPAGGFGAGVPYGYDMTGGVGHGIEIALYVACDPAPPADEPPDAENDSAITDENEAVRIEVLENDSDPDGGEIFVVANSDPGNGQVRFNGDETFTYTPDRGFTGTDTFTYTISDGSGLEDTATVSVEVIPAVGPPPDPDPDPDPDPPKPPPAPVKQCLAQPEVRQALGRERVGKILRGREGVQRSRTGTARNDVMLLSGGVQSDIRARGGNDLVITTGRVQGSVHGDEGRDVLCSLRGVQGDFYGDSGRDLVIVSGVQRDIHLRDGKPGDIGISRTQDFVGGGNDAYVDPGDRTKNVDRHDRGDAQAIRDETLDRYGLA